MNQLSLIAFWALLGLGGLIGAMLVPGASALAMRAAFRRLPEARQAFVGGGRWIAFSRRFGAPYAVGAIAAGFIWIWLANGFVPNTSLGAWLLFGPAMLSLFVGVGLGGLAVARWAAATPES